MHNESKYTQEHCNLGSISFQMLTEVLRARSFNILDALNGEQIDIAHIRRLATHMSLSADDLISVTELTNPPLSHSSELRGQGLGTKAEPSSLASVLELTKIASERRLQELSQRLIFESLRVDQFIAGNPWEVAWVLFFMISRIASSQAQETMNSSEIHIQVSSKENMVDLCIECGFPLTASESPELSKCKSALLSEHEWFCLSQILRKNDLYFIQSVKRTEEQRSRFDITIRLPTFQPGFE